MIDNLEKELDMLERHLEVLHMVLNSEPIGIVKISNETGHPHHKVRYSLRVLEEDSLVEPTSEGAVTTEHTRPFVSDVEGNIDDIVDRIEAMKTGAVNATS